MLLGKKRQGSHTCFVYGTTTLYGAPFKMLRLHARFITTHQHVSTGTTHPTTPTPQPLTGITQRRFSLIRFRSPLLTESLLFSLPAGTEMFHFPAFPPHTLYIQVQVTGHNSSRVSPFGYPRISPFIDSPRLIADYYGLHRFLVPRHPPCALKNLTTTHPTRQATTKIHKDT